jgi:hypothetical protein
MSIDRTVAQIRPTSFRVLVSSFNRITRKIIQRTRANQLASIEVDTAIVVGTHVMLVMPHSNDADSFNPSFLARKKNAMDVIIVSAVGE